MIELVAIPSPRHSEDSMDSKAEQKPMIAQRDLLSNAEDATDKEHNLTLFKAIKLYPKAIAWSAIMSASLIMDGYDLKLIGSLFAQPAFQKSFGHRQPNGTYQVSAPWQTGLNNGSNVGQMFGLLIAGVLAERFGFRKTMMGALVAVPCLIFIQFFASSLAQLQIGQILLGVPLGIFQTVSCVYAMEVVPICLRAYLTGFVSECWQIGQLLATCILRGTLHMDVPWAYRVPFAVQWFWPIPLLIAVILAPESPWWLVQQNRIEDAKCSVVRLTSAEEDREFDVGKNVALMVLTTEHEREANSGLSYLSCFRGTDLRRTIIVIGCYIVTVTTGSTVRATQPNTHYANNTSPVETPSTSVRSPSVISSLISQDIYLCTTIDLLAASEGSATPSLTYFHQAVESPFITPFDAANWVVFKERVIEMASYSSVVASAASAVQELYQARKICLPNSKALSLHSVACETFEKAVESGEVGDDFDLILMIAFLLAVFEMLVPQHTSRGPLAQSHGALVSQLETWHCNKHAHTPLSIRLAAWLLVSHAAARRSGNPGLLSGMVHDILDGACSIYPQLPPLDAGPRVPLSDHLISTLSEPLFVFYLRLQLLSTRVADLSHYHRSRTTGADQEEVSVLMSSLQGRIEALWQHRPRLMRSPPGELRAQLAPTVAEPLILLATLCSLTYYTELVEIGRNLSDSQRASPEARVLMAKAREIVSSPDCGAGLDDGGRPYVHHAYFRALFLYAIESFDEADTRWAVAHMRQIKDPVCYSEFFATFAEGLAEEQRAKGRRVTTKWWCWRVFGVTPPYL
ncbi:hypothetical protein B0A55_04787 [Friedmanniomyces simplex]|uniref:Major facilitator superfamily (MFS) profile domain-containing protein n=1 Tax=Friedmanniomyces simplex TaxID=329884 RepID=A0A4U0XRK4_9PEZI|nr:hypothetical protein B0A55_04787 [Friedmanniomyces simplex]